MGGRLSGTAAGERAGLAGDQGAGRQVPGVQPALVVGVEPAAGHIAQVDRGRAGAADVADLRQQRAHHLRLGGPALREVAEPRADERLGERRRGPVVEALAVVERATAHDGLVGLAAHRGGNDPDDHLAVLLRRDGHRPGRQPVEVVDGAVDGVDDPADAAGAVGAGALLPQEAVVGAVLPDEAGDQLLGGEVHLGDDVDGAGFGGGHTEVGGTAVAQQRTGTAGGLQGQFEKFVVQCVALRRGGLRGVGVQRVGHDAPCSDERWSGWGFPRGPRGL